MPSIRAILAGLGSETLTVFLLQLPLFRLQRWHYWTPVQHYGRAGIIVLAASVGSAVAARLAPRRPFSHAAPCLVIPALAVWDEWAIGDPQFAVAIALGSLVAAVVGVLAGQRARHRERSRGHLTIAEADKASLR